MNKRIFFIILMLLALATSLFLLKVLVSKEERSSDPEIKTYVPPNQSINEKTIEKSYIGKYELPIDGATGFTSITLNLYSMPDSSSTILNTIEAGVGFTILEEQSNWWKVNLNGEVGWLLHQYCFINLPDIIPSIIYNNTNTYKSAFVSTNISIPNISGQKLYEGYTYNERLGKKEFIIPVLYSMAEKIQKAQSLALNQDESLIIYEGYRPYAVQEEIVMNLVNLANRNKIVYNGISSKPWGIEWFVATGISNHQIGYAIDVSLAKVHSSTTLKIGPYSNKIINDFEEYTMPTNIHELSNASIVFTTPISSKDSTAWRTLQIAPSMNEPALKLQNYASIAGLTPLASEWWHFNDLDSFELVKEYPSTGKFYINDIFSVFPQ